MRQPLPLTPQTEHIVEVSDLLCVLTKSSTPPPSSSSHLLTHAHTALSPSPPLTHKREAEHGREWGSVLLRRGGGGQ